MSKKPKNVTKGTAVPVLEDKQITWEHRHRELEQKTFDQWFDEALKPDENKELKEENQRLKEAITENQKSSLPTYENAFIQQGDAWKIWFNGKELNPIKNMHGLTYLANLLSKPNKVIHVTTLCDSVNPQEKNQAMMEDDDVTDSLNRGDMYISTMRDGLSNEDKEYLKKEIAELNETIADDDLPKSERSKAQQKYNDLMKTLSNQYGKRALNGRPLKKINEAVKKDMDRVRKAIDRAYERIHKQSPELCDHLRKNIKTGSQCYYDHSDTLWHISF